MELGRGPGTKRRLRGREASAELGRVRVSESPWEGATAQKAGTGIGGDSLNILGMKEGDDLGLESLGKGLGLSQGPISG